MSVVTQEKYEKYANVPLLCDFRVPKSFQIFILTSGKFVARAKGERYNPTSQNKNLERDTYAILLAKPCGNENYRKCIQKEPKNGDICRVCWQKVVLFHEFYMRIESIYEQANKNRMATSILKVKEESEDVCPEQLEETIESESSLKCEPVFSEDSVGDLRVTQVFITESICDDQALNLEGVKTAPKQTKSRKKILAKKRKIYVKRPLTFKCTIRQCADEFTTKDDLIAHKIATHKRIQCTHCPDLKLVLDLNTHLKNMHGIIQNTVCEHCGQVFQSNATFLSHVKGVHEVHEPLQCDICKDWFKSRDSIRSHMTYVHIQGPQTCQICGKVSTNRKSLLKHQLIHIESRKHRYKCIVCGKGFRDKTKLKEHSYIHSGVTDAYSCNFCGKNFRFGSSLSAHRMKVHPIEMADVKYRLQWKKNVELKM